MPSTLGPEAPPIQAATATQALSTNTSSTASSATQVFSVNTAAQLAQTTSDAILYITLTAGGTTFTLNIGPANTTAIAIVPSSTVVAGQSITVRLPAGWWMKWNATAATIASVVSVTC